MDSNVILVTIDCLRADRLGCSGYKKPAPFIDSLAENGSIHTHAYATGPSTPTAFPGLLAGAFGLDSFCEFGLPDGMTRLAEVFSNNGFNTAGFHSNPYLGAAHGYANGFDRFYDYESQKGPSKLTTNIREKIRARFGENCPVQRMVQKGINSKVVKKVALGLSLKSYPYCDAEAIFTACLKWIQRQSEPFFAWVHLMDLHTPYMIRESYIKKHRKNIPGKKELLNAGVQATETVPDSLSAHNRQLLSDAYDAALNYVDDQFKLFMGRMDRKIRTRTLLTVTADHGEAFCEHGFFGHLGRMNYQNHFLYDEVVHVPMVLHYPGEIISGTCDDLVSCQGIGPTLLHYAGCPVPQVWEKIPLLRDQRNRDENHFVFTEGTVINPAGERKIVVSARSRKWKYIYNQMTEKDELYDLSKDPDEKINVISELTDVASSCLSLIHEHLNAIGLDTGYQGMLQEDTDDEKMIKRLKALGYM